MKEITFLFKDNEAYLVATMDDDAAAWLLDLAETYGMPCDIKATEWTHETITEEEER